MVCMIKDCASAVSGPMCVVVVVIRKIVSAQYGANGVGIWRFYRVGDPSLPLYNLTRSVALPFTHSEPREVGRSVGHSAHKSIRL